MDSTATSVPGSSLIPETTDLFTAGAFVVIAVLMALAIAAMVYGARLRARRKQGEHELRAHNAEIKEQAQAPPAVAPPIATHHNMILHR